MNSFPVRSFGSSKSRSFNPEWYSSYSWLEYSVERDAAFCRLFHINGTRAERTFTTIGFHDWKDAKGKKGILPVYDTCITHKQAICSWSSYTDNILLLDWNLLIVIISQVLLKSFYCVLGKNLLYGVMTSPLNLIIEEIFWKYCT